MAKRKRRKRTNNDLQNTTQKTKDLLTQCVNPNKKQRGELDDPAPLCYLA